MIGRCGGPHSLRHCVWGFNVTLFSFEAVCVSEWIFSTTLLKQLMKIKLEYFSDHGKIQGLRP